MIKEVIEYYYPDWEPPENTGEVWLKCLCPAHGDETPSAGVSYSLEAFNCFTCGYKGDYLTIVMKEEDCDFPTAVGIAESIASKRGVDLPPTTKRKPSRGISHPKRFGAGSGEQLSFRVRRRPFAGT